MKKPNIAAKQQPRSKATKPGKRKTRISVKQAWHLRQQVSKAPAWFTKDDGPKGMQTFDRNIAAGEWVRRVAELVLTTSGKELFQKVKKERNFAVTMIPWWDATDGYISKLEALKEMVGHAQARFMMAIASRVDMDQVLEEGRKSNA